MTLRNVIEAVAGQLTALWPDRAVYVDSISKGADGNFFVGIIETSQTKELDRRRRRTIQLQVLYFLREHDNLAFQDWAESMYDNFERLLVGQGGAARSVHLTGQKARSGDGQGVYQFFFDVDTTLLLAHPDGPGMESLEQKEALKE